MTLTLASCVQVESFARQFNVDVAFVRKSRHFEETKARPPPSLLLVPQAALPRSPSKAAALSLPLHVGGPKAAERFKHMLLVQVPGKMHRQDIASAPKS